jgi:large subunit ribosomal protein L21
MYAIVKIAGKQFRLEENKRLRVPLIDAESGKKVEFDNILAYNDAAGKLTIGTPNVEKVKISATVIEHGREKKVIVFKKKRRKGYQVKNGHRQDYSLIQVDKIGAGSAPKAKAETKPKAEEVKKEAAKPKAAPKPKAEAKAKTTVKPKTTAKPKTAAKPKAEKKEA